MNSCFCGSDWRVYDTHPSQIRIISPIEESFLPVTNKDFHSTHSIMIQDHNPNFKEEYKSRSDCERGCPMKDFIYKYFFK